MGERFPGNSRSRVPGMDVLGHEMANVLNGLCGMVELLRSSELTREQRRWLAAIESSSRQLNRLVRCASRQGGTGYGLLVPEIQLLDGIELLEHAVTTHAPTATASNSRLLLYTAPDLARSWKCDRGMLLQLIDNLLSNAIKFGAGRDVVLEARPGHGNSLILNVQDSGPGIPAAARHRVFRPYYREAGVTPAASGQGLGLFVCRQVVDVLGGSIRSVQPAEGGTRFEVNIPGVLKPAEPAGEGLSALSGLHCSLQLDSRLLFSVSGFLDRLGVSWSNYGAGEVGRSGPVKSTEKFTVCVSAGGNGAGLVLVPMDCRGAEGATSVRLAAPLLESVLGPGLLRLVLEQRWRSLKPGEKPG